MDVVVAELERLDRATLQSLLPLTNSPARGDHRDSNPNKSGSGFRRLLEDHLRGYQHPGKAWAIILREEGAPVAWCLVTELDRDPDTGDDFAVPTAGVGLYVAPAFRRQGLGSRLIREASDLARKIGRQQLMAFPWNASSKSFYGSRGFGELRPYFTGWTTGAALFPVQ